MSGGGVVGGAHAAFSSRHATDGASTTAASPIAMHEPCRQRRPAAQSTSTWQPGAASSQALAATSPTTKNDRVVPNHRATVMNAGEPTSCLLYTSDAAD